MHGFPHKNPRPVESPQRLSLDGQASLLSNNVFAYVVRYTERKHGLGSLPLCAMQRNSQAARQ